MSIFCLCSRLSLGLIKIQLKCCGYFNGTDVAEVGGSFCTSQAFIAALPTDESASCVGPITAFADSTLNNVFTLVILPIMFDSFTDALAARYLLLPVYHVAPLLISD